MFSSCILPLILISTDNSCRKQLLLSNLASAIFVFPSFLFLLLVGILWKRRAFSALWKVYLLLAWMHGLPFYSLGYNLLLQFILLLRVSHIWPVEVLSGWFLCPFDMTPSFLTSSLLSGITRCSGLILPVPCPRPGLGRCSAGLWGSFTVCWSVVLRKQDLSSSCIYWYHSVIASSPLSELS